VFVTKYHSGDQIRKRKACSTHWERYIQGSGGGTLRERDHLEKLGVDGRVILKLIFKKWDWAGIN
jgi:hypothetical protein